MENGGGVRPLHLFEFCYVLTDLGFFLQRNSSIYLSQNEKVFVCNKIGKLNTFILPILKQIAFFMKKNIPIILLHKKYNNQPYILNKNLPTINKNKLLL